MWRAERGRDPLYRDVPLRHVVKLPVLGVPVHFTCNAPRLANVVERAYRSFHDLDRHQRRYGHRVRIRIILHDDESRGRVQGSHPVVSRMPDPDRLVIQSGAAVALADVTRADGVIYVTQELLSAPGTFVESFLDPVVLVLVTHFDRVPIHAALVIHGRQGLLLAGPSGSGKSTLAYTAARAGYQVVADDTAYVQLRPRLRVWGAARTFRLPSGAGQWFPELRAMAPQTVAKGERKLVLGVSHLQRAGAALVARTARVCILQRGSRAARLQPISGAEVKRALTTNLAPGFDRFRRLLPSVAERLARPGGFRLTLSRNPADALRFIDSMLAQGEGQL